MAEQTKSTSTASASDKAKVMASILLLLFRTVLLILLISVAAALFPLQPTQPLWYLKVGQVLVDFGVTLLFVIFLVLMAGDYRSRYHKSSRFIRLARRICTISLFVYLLMLPVQLISYGLYWYATGQETSLKIRQVQSQAALLQNNIRFASNEAEFRAIIARDGIPLPPPTFALPLLQQKFKALDAIDGRFFQLRVKLEGDRKRKLAEQGVNSTKTVVGAGLIVYGMLKMRNLLDDLQVFS